MYLSTEHIKFLHNVGKNCTDEEIILLVGTSKNKVTHLHRVPNISKRNKDRYIPDPEIMFNVLSSTKLINENADLYFIGVYHTHPNGYSLPSEIDIKNANYDCFYLIYGQKDCKLQAYKQDRKNNVIFEKESIHEYEESY